MPSKDNHLSPKMKVAAARAMIREKNRYFTSLVNGMVYVWLPKGSLNTMAVSASGVIYLDEVDIQRMSVEATAVSILHEAAGHFLRRHFDRMPGGADPRLWNYAGDCEINDDLARAGWRDYPEGMIYPKTFELEDGLTVEQYYNELRQMQANGNQQLQDMKQAEEGAEGRIPGWCGSGAGRPLPGEPKPGEGQGDGDEEGEDGGQGQGSGQGLSKGAPGHSKGQGDRLRKRVAESIKKYEKNNGRGTVPGGWSRWADEQLEEPKVDWRTQLNQLVRDACAFRPGAVVTTWKRFGRRQAALGYGPGRPLTPAWRNPVPNVSVVIDTSGSMGHRELKQAAEELKGILDAVMAEVQFIAIDSQVHTTTVLTDISQLAEHLKGGGGTDFRPAFKELANPKPGQPRPEVVVFITDGDGPAPEIPPPHIKVVWVLVGRYARKPYLGKYGGAEVNWGTFIQIDEEDLRARQVA